MRNRQFLKHATSLYCAAIFIAGLCCAMPSARALVLEGESAPAAIAPEAGKEDAVNAPSENRAVDEKTGTTYEVMPPVAGPPVDGVQLNEEENIMFAAFPDDGEFYDLLLRVRRKDETLSEAVIGVQKGFDNYVPMLEIARLTSIAAEPDFVQGTVRGFFVKEGNPFVIDTQQGTYTMNGETLPLPPDSVIVRDVGYGLGEFYIKPEVLEEIWPLGLELDFSEQTLNIDTKMKLPYELAREREDKRARLGAGGEDVDNKNWPLVPNDYKMIGKPFLNLNEQISRDGSSDEIKNRFVLNGKNDFLGTSADYNASILTDKENLTDLQSARLRFTRKEFGNDSMPLGVKTLQLGDVTDRSPDLIDKTVRGRGISVSSKPDERASSFDEITVQGTGEPGWEVEVYRRGELLDYGTIDERGEYLFEDIPLLFGNNEIQVFLYGPQGQVEEYSETYNIGSQMLPPGETEYAASIIDYDKDLIPTRDDEPRLEGISKHAEVKQGVTRWLTGFATYTQTPTEQDMHDYVTAGANFSALGGLGLIEGYKDLQGGTALDTRYSIDIAGVRTRLRHSIFNDFESEEAQYGPRAKTSESEIQLHKGFMVGGAGRISLGAEAEQTKYVDERKEIDLNLTQAWSLKGNSLNNRFRTRLIDGEHRSTEGVLSYNTRFSPNWRLRSILDYDFYPEYNLDRLKTELTYDDRDKFQASVDIDRDLDSHAMKYGADASYDFGLFLGGVSANYSQDNGVDVRLTTSTALAPIGEDESYVMSSESSLGRSLLKARLFHDKDLDGVFSPGDVPLQGAKLRIDGRSTDASDADGIITTLNAGRQGYANVTLDPESLENPFMVTEKEGYRTLLRPTSMPFIDVPVVESGAVDGVASFHDGRPIPGLRVQLIDENGDQVMETASASDGFFHFEFVKPGNYKLRVDPEHKIRVPEKNLTVSSDNLFAYGVNLQMLAPPDLTPQKRNVLYNVLGKLKDMNGLLQKI